MAVELKTGNTDNCVTGGDTTTDLKDWFDLVAIECVRATVEYLPID